MPIHVGDKRFKFDVAQDGGVVSPGSLVSQAC